MIELIRYFVSKYPVWGIAFSTLGLLFICKLISVVLFRGMHLPVDVEKLRNKQRFNKSKEDTGKIGEIAVSTRLKALNKKDYKVYNDVYLIRSEGYFNQIDHVVISRYGIFVIETKNINGVIFGDNNSKNWTAKNKDKSFEFYNPILQNEGHIKALMQNLGLSRSCFCNIVCFTNRATLKLNVKNVNVMHLEFLFKYIKHYNSIVFSQEEFENICNKLEKFKIKKEATV